MPIELILDTNFLIELGNSNPDAMAKAHDLERERLPRNVPRIVITELWISVGKGTQTERNRRKYERVLAELPIVDMTDRIARTAGELEGATQASDPHDSGVGLADAIIAATALEFDEPVVTNDRTDFVNRIQRNHATDLRVELFT